VSQKTNNSLSCKVLVRLRDEITLVLFLFAVPLHFLLKDVLAWPEFSFAVGLICFVFVPGYFLATLLGKRIGIDAIGYSFILGLAIPILSIALYGVLSYFIWIDFTILLLFTTIAAVVLLRFSSRKLGITFSYALFKADMVKSLHNPAFYIFILAFITRFSFSSYNTSSILPDGSLYLDSARALASKSIFSSNVLSDESFGILTSSGMIEHSFVNYVFAFFFSISSVSLKSAILGTVFIGSLVVFPIFDLGRTFFGKSTGIIAAFLICFHPLYVYFSSILFGPEITGLLFLLVSFYLLAEGAKGKSPLVLVTAGILLGISEEIWWYQFYIVILFVPLLIIMFYPFSEKKGVHTFRVGASRLAVSGCLVFLYVFVLKIYSLYFLYLPILIIEMVMLSLLMRSKLKYAFLTSCFVAGLIVPTALSVIRHYIFPSQVFLVVKETMDSGIIQSIVGAFTLFFNGTLFHGVLDCSNYLLNYATIIVVALFLLAFLDIKNIRGRLLFGCIILLDISLVSLIPPPTYPLYLSSQGRYYLLPIALMILVCSTFLAKVFQSITVRISAAHLIQHSRGKKYLIMLSILLVLAVILPVLFFAPQYQTSVQAISEENPIQKYGWSDEMISWIQANTSRKDVLLTSRARELAWFTDRKTVSISCPPLNLKDIQFEQLYELTSQFNATYIVSDIYFSWSYPKLQSLSNPTNGTLGVTVSCPDTASHGWASVLVYELVFLENSTHSQCNIWRLKR
jgi:hypothetical protein